MRHLSHFRPQQLIAGLCAIVVLSALGCREAEQIHSYSAPKEPKVEVAAATPANAGEPTDRMLAAILPAGGQAWFFKVVGPVAAVDKREKEINDFFAGIRAADGRPKWELPASWKEEAGTQMRFATIVIPNEEKPLEITVNVASWRGAQESLLPNVNRWRGQLQLPDAGPQQLAEFTHEIKAGDASMTIVDLRGRFKGGMTPPFAGGPVGAASRAAPDAGTNLPPGHPPLDSSATPTEPQDSKTNLPPGHPPIDSASAAPPRTADAPPSAGVPHFETPTGWTPLPAGGVRKAAFAIGNEQQGALVTVINFPATEGPMIADPLQNVNRWRREVGFSEIEKDKLSSATESIKIDGQPATYVRLIPDAAQADQPKSDRATLAAMVTSGNGIWFIKLTGNRAVVAAQEDAFKKFLTSVRFAADGGAPDGNK